MKVIFLDIDGVLNTEAYITAFFDIIKQLGLFRAESNSIRRLELNDKYGNRFDPMTVKWLKWVIESTDAKIVISSTWRLAGLQYMQKMWKDRNLPGEVIGVTPSFMHERGTTLCRGEEVHRWIDMWKKENQGEDFNYVAIDDDKDLLPLCEGHFVKTQQEYGLTYDDALKVIEILNNSSILTV